MLYNIVKCLAKYSALSLEVTATDIAFKHFKVALRKQNNQQVVKKLDFGKKKKKGIFTMPLNWCASYNRQCAKFDVSKKLKGF